ncbi:glycoside hydrolase family 12 protein [Phanerochaete carnosa HHB-10118-sp]|uniref:Glycoside hydrolase family 12 protein n=1 Tax=Phanerochaete carnosa (strain HHB-10118-sp) TaxID=650164 RepID=K5VP71_PHACS|nr:glycoside hydrolase family 12 protein [Phanerochaete carnosa HHB-10118-sp]EKM53263.1 glycoside hydrolase family 12 protein [Phanerochaete carnosa HHB-10118-sp]
MFSKLLIASLVSLALASPTPAGLESRASIDTSTHCGQWDTVTATQYELLLDQWGISGATGSQCASLVSLSDSTISWKTNWTWSEGSGGVKSFTDIQLNQGINQQLSAISSMPTTWKWSQSSSGTVVADVAYDLFTSNTAGGSNVNEIMIWLANYNAGPISSSYSSSGQPVPVASDISLAGQSWNLYSGSNGANNVFSFLPVSGTITSFSGDVMDFLNLKR